MDSNMMSIVMILGLVVVFYFLLIRPESKRKKELAKMRDELSVGDDITTIGGLVGKVVNIKDDLVTFETSEDRVRIEVIKAAVNTKGHQGGQGK